MEENASGKIIEKDRSIKWEMAFKARMKQIVPSLFFGNVEHHAIVLVIWLDAECLRSWRPPLVDI